MIIPKSRVFLVRIEGLEPPCREALDPKSSASTNFAISAFENRAAKLKTFLKLATLPVVFLSTKFKFTPISR